MVLGIDRGLALEMIESASEVSKLWISHSVSTPPPGLLDELCTYCATVEIHGCVTTHLQVVKSASELGPSMVHTGFSNVPETQV